MSTIYLEANSRAAFAVRVTCSGSGGCSAEAWMTAVLAAVFNVSYTLKDPVRKCASSVVQIVDE